MNERYGKKLNEKLSINERGASQSCQSNNVTGVQFVQFFYRFLIQIRMPKTKTEESNSNHRRERKSKKANEMKDIWTISFQRNLCGMKITYVESQSEILFASFFSSFSVMLAHVIQLASDGECWCMISFESLKQERERKKENRRAIHLWIERD